MKALPIADAKDLTRGEIDRLEKMVRKELGAKGLGWIRVEDDGEWKSPITKFLGEPEIAAIQERCDAAPGMVIFFQADTKDRANTILSRLREDLGVRLGRVDGRKWDPLLVVDFPLLEPDENGKLGYVHQPFVAPVEEESRSDTEPRGTRHSLRRGAERDRARLRFPP